MIQFLSEMNWQLILGIILVSAFVAYVGDVVGMRLGKKRISFFRLRPRHTSSIITAITGLLIALGVLTVLSFTSDSVRTALFSMKYIQRQITDLTSQVQDSREELADMQVRLFDNEQDLVESQQDLFEVEKKLDLAQSRTEELESAKEGMQKELAALQEEKVRSEAQVRALREEAENLRTGLEEVREGRIVVFSGELLGQVPIPGGSSVEQVKKALDEIQSRARYFVALRFGGKSEEISLALPEESELSRLVQELQQGGYRKVLRLLAASNAVQGEAVEVELRTYVSEKVYREGQRILSRVIPEVTTEEQAETELYSILSQVNSRAVSDGVLPDPLRKTVGNLSATDFYEALDSLAKSRGKVEVSIFALEDIYSEGPVRVGIKIVPEP